MTIPPDDLHELWISDPGMGRGNTPELVRDLETAAKRFDRTIRFRDLRETAGGLLVAAVFVWLAVHDQTSLECAAHVWLAACGLWIAVYMRRYSKAARQPAPEQSLVRYQRELLDRYDRQVRLLKSAKYWYILPLWAGLLFSAAATLVRTGNLVQFGLVFGFITILNAVVWWLNEGVGVAHLRNRRRQLVALTGMEGASE